MFPLRSHYVPTPFQVGPLRVFDTSKAFDELSMNDLMPNIVAPSQMIAVAMIIQLFQENLNDWSCPFQFVQRTIELYTSGCCFWSMTTSHSQRSFFLKGGW